MARSLSLLLVLLAACGPSPAQQAADGRDRAGSWAATIKAATEAWAGGVVPAHYLASTLDAASQDLQKEAESLRKSAGDSAAAPLDAVRRAIPAIQADVARDDRDAARTAAAALSRQVPPPAQPPSAQNATR